MRRAYGFLPLVTSSYTIRSALRDFAQIYTVCRDYASLTDMLSYTARCRQTDDPPDQPGGFRSSRSAATRRARSAGGSAIVSSLFRLVSPTRTVTADRRTPNAFATATSTAFVALPSTAAAVTATTNAGPYGPSYRPPTRVQEAPGRTRTGTVAWLAG